jgi:uncharacterized membrane protein YhaH (DUF805 family)/Tfp pilus assembly major pilin PilA
VENRNPYASPSAQVADAADSDYGEVRIFSASGRLGRVRYLGYSIGLSLLIAIAMGILVGAATAAGGSESAVAIAGLIGIAGYIAILAIQFLLAIQRAHDFDTSGWLALLVVVPLVNLIFLFIPGTRGENRFGKRPPPNTAGVIILACLLPLVAVVGILAAIAIPAYQDYTIRAQVSEGLSLAAAPRAAVAQAFRNSGTAPADRLSAGLQGTAADGGGTYVASVDVASGTILVTYGGRANPQIAGKVLALQPYVMTDKTVAWRCGKAPAPAGAAAMDPSAPRADGATQIEPRFLPSACRP